MSHLKKTAKLVDEIDRVDDLAKQLRSETSHADLRRVLNDVRLHLDDAAVALENYLEKNEP